MQVYRDLRIITARPTPEEEARVTHRLYGHVDAAENYSVGRWLPGARTAPDEGGQRGGGAVPPVPAESRAAVRARLEAEGTAALHAELVRRDPSTQIRASDRTRIVRSLEVIEATGRSLSHWHRGGLPPLLDGSRAVKVFLAPERDDLRRRIDARFDAMLAAGALDEVRALAARKLDPLLPAMKAHGVPWLMRHLSGEITLAEAAEGGKADTRRYTKRQFTWVRHQLPDWTWIAPTRARDEVLDAFGR